MYARYEYAAGTTITATAHAMNIPVLQCGVTLAAITGMRHTFAVRMAVVISKRAAISLALIIPPLSRPGIALLVGFESDSVVPLNPILNPQRSLGVHLDLTRYGCEFAHASLAPSKGFGCLLRIFGICLRFGFCLGRGIPFKLRSFPLISRNQGFRPPRSVTGSSEIEEVEGMACRTRCRLRHAFPLPFTANHIK